MSFQNKTLSCRAPVECQLVLALSMVILDEVLQQVHALLRLYLIDFDQILSDTQSQSINQSSINHRALDVGGD